MTCTYIINLLHKSIIDKNYIMIPTEKNRNSRRKYGLTLEDLEDFLLTIIEKDLYKGPELDKDRPGEYLFVFKKKLKNNIYFYIKIKSEIDQNDNEIIKILSCHEEGYYETTKPKNKKCKSKC